MAGTFCEGAWESELLDRVECVVRDYLLGGFEFSGSWGDIVYRHWGMTRILGFGWDVCIHVWMDGLMVYICRV